MTVVKGCLAERCEGTARTLSQRGSIPTRERITIKRKRGIPRTRRVPSPLPSHLRLGARLRHAYLSNILLFRASASAVAPHSVPIGLWELVKALTSIWRPFRRRTVERSSSSPAGALKRFFTTIRKRISVPSTTKSTRTPGDRRSVWRPCSRRSGCLGVAKRQRWTVS